MDTEETDVLVVGAGLAGLSTALFLAQHEVPALVVDRHPGTSVQPKARGQSPFVMEAFRAAGVAEAILAAAPPGKPGLTIAVAESMAGRVLHSFTEELPDPARYSPAPFGLASQARAEAALAERARELGARIRFRTRLEELEQDRDGVTVTLHDLAAGTRRRVRARYVVAADGHRGGIRERLGIGAHGRGGFDSTTCVRFRADLSAHAGDNAVVLYYLRNPELPAGSGVIVSTDSRDEWVAGMAPDPARSDAGTAEVIRALVGRPDLEPQVLDSATWQSAHQVADRFAEGRVLLVGDAAHVMPPTGGQGGNTAVLDGYHLAWKLAAVVRGEAGPALLDSHDAERRPYAEAVCEWQVANLVVRQRPDLAGDGIGPPMDGNALLFGYVCPTGAFVADPGAADSMFDDPDEPSGRPGSRVPHVWLDGSDGAVSTRELLGPHFLVLTGSAEGVAAAKAAAASLGIALRAHRVGPDGLVDRHGEWARRSGVGPHGTVLVRPDGVVGWRSTTSLDIAGALHHILARPRGN